MIGQDKMKILVTGSTGFVGKVIVEELLALGHDVVPFFRDHDTYETFRGFDVVIHLAAKVHDFKKVTYDEYRTSNVDLTEKLIKKSILGNVKQFIFLSTIKVCGEGKQGQPYQIEGVPNPSDYYSKSKWEAEQLIHSYAASSGLTYLIIRPPLIYGPNVKANFLRLWQLSRLKIPLPFGLVKNRRSFLFVKNLSSFIVFSLGNKKLTNQTVLLCDGQDISTYDLVMKLSGDRVSSLIMLPVPMIILKLLFYAIRKSYIYDRICGDLYFEKNYLFKDLDWIPPYGVDEGLKITSDSLEKMKMPHNYLKRFIDLVFLILCSVILIIPFCLTYIYITLLSPGPVFYWSKRIGFRNRIFFMPKFRTMRLDTPQVATHLLANPDQYLIPGGKLIRKLSLDELPQLYSVFNGDMSFVGPRPALFNQEDLIQLRTEKLVHHLRPGITGWAQVNGRDEIPISQKVELDYFYLKNRTLFFDLKILVLTFYKVLFMKDISH